MYGYQVDVKTGLTKTISYFRMVHPLLLPSLTRDRSWRSQEKLNQLDPTLFVQIATPLPLLEENSFASLLSC